MNAAVVGDVDGDGVENELVYQNSATGGLGYYKIPGDGAYHPENDHIIPGVPADSIPLTVLRTSVMGSLGIIIFKSNSAGTSGALLANGVGLTDLGWMERAYAVDARGQGFRGDLLWCRDYSSMFWRESVTGYDHASPFTNIAPLGWGSTLSDQQSRTLLFYSPGLGGVCAADNQWNYTAIAGTNWNWLINEGSHTFGDIDGDGFSEILHSTGPTDFLRCYKAPPGGGPFNANGISTDPSVTCGWGIHGVAQVELQEVVGTSVERVSDLLALPDGTNVVLAAKPRTQLVVEMNAQRVPVQTGYYLEETDRTAGIRVMGTTSAPEGQFVTVAGTLSTTKGERTLLSSGQLVGQQNSKVQPIATTIKAVSTGLTMTGLLVKLTGTIVSANPSLGQFYIRDAYQQTLKVYCHDLKQTSGVCTLTGCMGRETISGSATRPVLRVESASGTGSITPPTPPVPPTPPEPPEPPPATQVSYFCWTETSAVKVAKTDAVKTLQSVALRAARNEHEAFQIVLRGDTAAVNAVTLQASSLTGTAGTIAASNVKLYLPYYIRLPYYSRDVADPLPAYKAPFDLAAGQTQPVWVDVEVPKTAAAGDYSGYVEITSTNGKTTRVNYTFHVYNFTLPDESKLATQFDFDSYYMAPKEGVTYGSPESKALWKQYYEFLLQRGISTAAIPADDFLSAEAANYLRDTRLTSFRIPYDPNPSTQRSYFNQVKACGAWGRGFCDVADEVYAQSDYALYKTKASFYINIDPTARTLATYYSATPTWAAPKQITDLLAGYVRVWCPISGDAFKPDRLAARRAAGDEVWTYVCTNPDGITPNFFLQDPAISHRMIAWQCYLHQATGWLYWHSNFWRDVADPWTDMCTGKGIDSRLYGEGSLIYPGKVHTGTAGPVSSVRLEVFRDSLDDYKYMWLLEQKIGRAGVVSYVQQVATDWHSYSKDPAKLISVRDSIAQRIEN